MVHEESKKLILRSTLATSPALALCCVVGNIWTNDNYSDGRALVAGVPIKTFYQLPLQPSTIL
jgi:hypothetical protein